MLEEAGQCLSVCLAREVNWLWVWEATRDRGQFWTNISQSFLNYWLCRSLETDIAVCVMVLYLRILASSHTSLRTILPVLLTLRIF